MGFGFGLGAPSSPGTAVGPSGIGATGTGGSGLGFLAMAPPSNAVMGMSGTPVTFGEGLGSGFVTSGPPSSSVAGSAMTGPPGPFGFTPTTVAQGEAATPNSGLLGLLAGKLANPIPAFLTLSPLGVMSSFIAQGILANNPANAAAISAFGHNTGPSSPGAGRFRRPSQPGTTDILATRPRHPAYRNPDYGGEQRPTQISPEEQAYQDWYNRYVATVPAINLFDYAGSQPISTENLMSYTADQPTLVPTIFSEGGAVMPGLGFRPLGYSTGTGPTGVEDDYIGNVISEFNNLFTNEQMTDVVDLVNANPKVFFARDLDPMVANIIQYLVTEGHVKRPPTADQITAETERVIAPPAPVGAGMDMPYPPEDLTDTFSALINPPQGTSPVGAQYQAGGHVGRGTMAGELGRRGDLSVRQAGETMQERWKRMHGYAGGGYASRGTVAGELPRYGHMSVREEGESMGELAKRHRDQDWYNRMGRGLGSLRRRMA